MHALKHGRPVAEGDVQVEQECLGRRSVEVARTRVHWGEVRTSQPVRDNRDQDESNALMRCSTFARLVCRALTPAVTF